MRREHIWCLKPSRWHTDGVFPALNTKCLLTNVMSTHSPEVRPCKCCAESTFGASQHYQHLHGLASGECVDMTFVRKYGEWHTLHPVGPTLRCHVPLWSGLSCPALPCHVALGSGLSCPALPCAPGFSPCGLSCPSSNLSSSIMLCHCALLLVHCLHFSSYLCLLS